MAYHLKSYNDESEAEKLGKTLHEMLSVTSSKKRNTN